jgi:hypothetical protein
MDGMAAVDRDREIEHGFSELESHIVVEKSSVQIGFQLGCVLGLLGSIFVGRAEG